MKLDDAQIELYSRQILLRELGGLGQKRLLASRALVAGDDAAAEVAASYLAGAGVGAVDLWSGAGEDAVAGAGDARGLALPPLAERAPGIAIAALSAATPIDLACYDLVVTSGAPAFAAGSARSLRARGRGEPRRGTVRIAIAASAVTLLCAPAGLAPCWACLAVADEDAPARPPGAIAPEPDPIAQPSAGAMAALLGLCWLAEIDAGAAVAARALRLAHDGAAWLDAAPSALPACPRGCQTRG